ncbi:MAG: ATP-binding protein [Pseudomonadota bacterium]
MAFSVRRGFRPAFSVVLTSEYTSIAPAMDRIRASIRPILALMQQSDADLDVLETVLVEVVNNIIRHAYHGRPGQPIHIGFWQDRDRVFLGIWDRGRPFSFASLPPPTTAAPSLQAAPESGFGWLIIRGSVDDLTYERVLEWNILILEKRL